MGRLRRSDQSSAGISRVRRGKGFQYFTPGGGAIRDGQTRTRINELAIPPAWTDVWICPDADGHIQATGVDGEGRKQYVYSDRWRAGRDRMKFDRMLEFSDRLPAARRAIRHDLALDGMPKERVLACAARLLDRGFFRVGSEEYAKANGSFGLATLRKDHVRVSGTEMCFCYLAKGGKDRHLTIDDADAAKVVRTLRRRRNGGPDLLAFQAGGDTDWSDIRSRDINGYLKEIAGEAFSAKDFRTWHATVLAASFLAARDPDDSPTAQRRAVSSSIGDVAEELGNTPAVCRRSYVDPRVIDRFIEGKTIAHALSSPRGAVNGWAHRTRVETAVRELIIGSRTSSSPVAKAA